MRTSKISSQFEKSPHVVGIIDSSGSLQSALGLLPGSLDFLELRVDNFGTEPSWLPHAVSRLKLPLILTVRHPAEGGANELTVAKRRELFMEYLPYASIIDVELRSMNALSSIIALAREKGVRVLVSAHHFQSTPAAKQLGALLARAKDAGADLFKLAALTSSPADVATLLSLFAHKEKLPLSVMGMGKFGRASRLLFAQAGSVLNYGYLDKPNTSGQWEAIVLKARIAEICDGL